MNQAPRAFRFLTLLFALLLGLQCAWLLSAELSPVTWGAEIGAIRGTCGRIWPSHMLI